MIKNISFLIFALCLYAFPAFGGNYEIDPVHSYIGFSIKHMIISNVKGNFSDFSGNFEFEEKTKTVKFAEVQVKTSSIDTRNEKRDKHLRSEDFFHVEKFPVMKFVLKSTKNSGNQIILTGNLTIHGITQTVELKSEFLGAVKDPWGKRRAGFTLTGLIDRFDFGLKYSKALETGGLVVGREVKMILEVEGILKE